MINPRPVAMQSRKVYSVLVSLSLAFLVTPAATSAQSTKKAVEKPAPKIAFNQASYDSAMLSEFAWRPIGPAVTSGRVVALAVAEDPESRIGGRLGKLMYAAAASGGVWKSANAGTTWEPIFDNQSTSSIGDIAIAPSNPEVVWVGTGESNNQRSSSWGDGVYKSENGGRTWQHMGLRTSQHIGQEVDEILKAVRGGGEANDADDRTRFKPSIQDRVNQVAGEIGDVTSPPTQLQRATLELAMKDLARESARLNALLTTRVPALNTGLDAA